MFQRNWAFIDDVLQTHISQTRILLAGVGMGSRTAEYLVRIGFCRLTIADGDTVSRTNLNRQAFTRADIGLPKAEVVARNLRAINPEIQLTVVPKYLEADDIRRLVEDVDLVVNTIDFDHPCFHECCRIVTQAGKTVLFPMAIGWGAALLILTQDSATIEESAGFQKGETASDDQLKVNLILRAIGPAMPDYLASLEAAFRHEWTDAGVDDPQLIVGVALGAALVTRAAVRFVQGLPLPLAPHFMHCDLTTYTDHPPPAG